MEIKIKIEVKIKNLKNKTGNFIYLLIYLQFEAFLSLKDKETEGGQAFHSVFFILY